MWYYRLALNIWWSLNILRDTGRFGQLSLTPWPRAGTQERLRIRNHQAKGHPTVLFKHCMVPCIYVLPAVTEVFLASGLRRKDE